MKSLKKFRVAQAEQARRARELASKKSEEAAAPEKLKPGYERLLARLREDNRKK